jgi:hypothetical protein
MQVEDGIGRQPLRLIGFVTHKVLTADEQCIVAAARAMPRGPREDGYLRRFGGSTTTPSQTMQFTACPLM